MSKTLIKNAAIINEGLKYESDILIQDEIITKIGRNLSSDGAEILDTGGNFVLPGIIDDQVHFREPGLTHKGDIASESRAAIAGGITSFMEQPNTNPQTTTLEKLEQKFELASKKSYANYSFLFGGTNDNLEEIKKLDKYACSGIKLFLGSSTGNMLVDNEEVLERIFMNTELVISAHCEDEKTIRENTQKFRAKYGDDIPVEYHPLIRSEEACYLSSSRAIALAEKTGARLHVFHVSTGRETGLFRNDIPLEQKKITAEVCIHHLWFSDKDYSEKGMLIKWNPAVKTSEDRDQLWQALLDDRIDIVATDHAPHTLEEKQNFYMNAPSGGPLVQHALTAMLEKTLDGIITIEKVVEKMCHNPAKLFQISKRGFIREGYYADLAIVDLNSVWTVDKNNILYKCGWSPFDGTRFRTKVLQTFVNGHLAYNNGQFSSFRNAKRLTFDR
ncbi:dihydroorotase [uncultured Eudoraea sp.]|uniref:dihydroorotase n=1 Tax=uncultured Eudoraea sp. TaxID=1035614 RepID=UPI00260CECFE|nr:dihydroorotase [uncultured Eudoraea sp.]